MTGHIPWEQLPPVDNRPDLRWIGRSKMISKVEYDREDWQVLGSYMADDGSEHHYWAMTYAGIDRAAQHRRERQIAARTRREADDEYSQMLSDEIQRYRP
jgi:hypothetical protein